MPSKLHQTAIVTSLILLSVEASKDCNPNSPNPNFPTPESRFTVSQHLSIDPIDDSVDVSAETEALAFYSDIDESLTDEASSSIVSSSLVYDGGCYVSSQAMMCSGGAGDDMDMFLSRYGINFDTLDNDDSDDDDADDDGHSSMLSNTAIRRARVPAMGDDDHGRNRRGGSDSSDRQPMPRSSSTGCTALSLRGGASSLGLGSEFGKKLLVAAIVTLTYEALLGHFLEFVKIVMQTSAPGTGYGDVLKSITAQKGVLGVWDGFVPWGVVQAVFKGGVFGLAHAIATQLLLPLAEGGKLPMQLALTLAGGIAGGFQGYVLSPTLLLKTRVMTNPVFRESMSLLRTTVLSFQIGIDVVANEGIGVLMKGSNVFATKRIFDWATRFYFADVFESLLSARKGGEPLKATDKIVASLLGGTASTLCTLPLDVLVAKTQDAKKAGIKVSPLEMFRAELKELGWGGMYGAYMHGFEARLAHVCFTTVAMKTGSPFVYDILFGVKS